MLPDGAKRFYDRVEIVREGAAVGISLDGRAVRTPAGNDLSLPTDALAEALRDEWDAQEETIQPASMPMMQLACTVIDRVMPHRVEIVEQTAAFGGTDMLCYLSDGPEDLVQRQRDEWGAVLEWAAEALTAPLETASGILHVAQPQASLDALKSHLDGLDPWHLTAVAQMTQVLGSLVLALAVGESRLEAGEAFRLSMLDEDFQAERWGEDREALLRRRAMEQDVSAAGRFLALL